MNRPRESPGESPRDSLRDLSRELSRELPREASKELPRRVAQRVARAMLMEKNGRNSCTGNSRHINIRYFFIKDRIDKKEVKVEYCPTEHMVADYFCKPLFLGIWAYL